MSIRRPTDDLDRKIIQKLKENCVKPFVRIWGSSESRKERLD